MIIAVIGGGAAGFFSALAAKKINPKAEIILLEKTAKLLSKVRISGGGRCNVTHACFDPKKLIENYPRGKKELLGPFHTFQPRDTIQWFEERSVTLKQEKDGRMFPVTDSSETIINCLLEEAEKLGVQILTQTKLKGIKKVTNGFELEIREKSPLFANRLILATGSSSAGWDFAKDLGHSIIEPVPSLFTFNIPNFSLVPLSGVSVNPAKVKLEGGKFEQKGPLLITHWGFSGPAALKLSALEARSLAEKEYKATLIIDWLPELSENEIRELIKANNSKKLSSIRIHTLPNSLWKAFIERQHLTENLANAVSKANLAKLCDTLKRDRYDVRGKTTNKEEFVTCGGVKLSEVQFKTMESKQCKNLFFCGEVLDIDGVTGGFNFQNAWTTGWIAGRAAASNSDESFSDENQ